MCFNLISLLYHRRQRQILAYVAQGLALLEIAQRLHVSVERVRTEYEKAKKNIRF